MRRKVGRRDQYTDLFGYESDCEGGDWFLDSVLEGSRQNNLRRRSFGWESRPNFLASLPLPLEKAIVALTSD